ncbi:MAG TPA: tetratricopeptide repeat protein [Candidatus Sulfotelmatobacter sp.]|nr:tetratricopeptide repeat protein [Candidatus Sulfotelmatobacter sp.]
MIGFGQLQTTRRFWPRMGTLLVAVALATPALADDLKDARAALQAGRVDQAATLFGKLASQGQIEGHIGLGQVYLKKRQYSKAQDEFKLTQRQDPTVAWGYYGEGEALKRQGKCDDAVPLMRKATDLDKRFPEATLSLGDCLVQQKQVDAAIAVLSPGAKWGSKWRPKFLVALGNAELARDSLRSASVYYTQAREESPEDPAPRKALGDFYLYTRRIAELAIPEYEAAVQLDSSDVELHYALGEALFAGQRYNEALDQYKWVVATDPDFPPGQLSLGNLYFLSGPNDPRRYADARAPLEKYTQLEPNDAKGWSLLGRTYYYLKMKDEAVQAMEKSLTLGGANKETFTIMARVYAEKKDWQKSLDAFAKGEPTSRDMLTIGQMWVFLGKPERADSIYQAVVAKDSTSADARFALNESGKLHFRRQEYPIAIAIFQRVIALDPSNDEAYYYLGLAYKELKQYPDALNALRQAATLAPGKADRQFWLGILYAQLDSTALSRAALEKSVAIDSSGQFAGVAYRQLGYYRLLDKEYEGAISLLERAVALNDKDIQAWVWLGQGNQNAGHLARAAECYRKVLALDPKQPDAQKGLQSLPAAAPK